MACQQLTPAIQKTLRSLSGTATYWTALSVASVARGPFVGTLTSDEARTITVVQQKITNKDNPTARAINTRIELYLVRTSHGWKIDRVSSTS